MAKKPQRGRTKPENPRKYKKKTSPLLIEKVEYVDYKDVDLLSRFMSDRAKIRNMRVSGNNRQQQLEIAKAIKISREMALLPYARRVASSGRPGRGRDGGRDGGRDDRRPPRDEGSDSKVEAASSDATDETVVDAAAEAVVETGADTAADTVNEGGDA
jgi:small subunit ribosomal protein S18